MVVNFSQVPTALCGYSHLWKSLLVQMSLSLLHEERRKRHNRTVRVLQPVIPLDVLTPYVCFFGPCFCKQLRLIHGMTRAIFKHHSILFNYCFAHS